MKLFDTHVHLLSERYEQSAQSMVDAFSDSGIVGVIEASSDEVYSKKAVALAEANDSVYCAVGVHPHDAKDASKNYIQVIGDLAKSQKVVAIGEIGLDYHYDFSPRNIQMRVFREQIELAKSLDKPIIIHSREATKDTLDALKSLAPVKGVVHCFGGSAETARILIDMGLYISFTGTLTFKNAHKVVEAFLAIPMDRVMAETDCPYMTPEPFRGKTNVPKYVRFVIEKMAALKGISAEDMAAQNIQNAKACFGVFSR